MTDNADLVFIRDGLDMLLPKLAKVVHNLAKFALQYKDLPTLGFTYAARLLLKSLLLLSGTANYCCEGTTSRRSPFR